MCVARAGAAFDEGCSDGGGEVTVERPTTRPIRRRAMRPTGKAQKGAAITPAMVASRRGGGGKAPMKGKQERYVHSYITMSIAEHPD